MLPQAIGNSVVGDMWPMGR